MSPGAFNSESDNCQKSGLQLGSSKAKLEGPAQKLIIDTDKCLQLIIPCTPRFRTSSRIASRSTRSSNEIERGSLQIFMDLPLDLTFEIAKHLNAPDLLTLIRLNKRFRSLLLRRSAAWVWRECIANTPKLPPCPPDMQEPQYVSFVLPAGAYCMACGYDLPSNLKSYPTLRLRLCSNCSLINLIKGKELADSFGLDVDRHQLLSIIPSSDSLFTNSSSSLALTYFYFKPEAEIIMAAYLEAKKNGNLPEFLEQRRVIRDEMTSQGKWMAACMQTESLAVNTVRFRNQHCHRTHMAASYHRRQ